MKTERRHELKHNELADFVAHSADRMRPYWTGILGVAAAAAGLLLVYFLLSNTSERRRREAFDVYFEASSSPQGLAKLDELAQQYPSDDAGILAQLSASEQRLAKGTDDLFTDRAAARDELRKALQGYAAVRQATDDPFLLQLAMWGEAKTYEALGFESVDDLKKAVSLYQDIAKQYPDGPLAKESTRRAEDLQRQSTLDFYTWFAGITPPPPSPPPGSQPPFDLDSVPDGPDIVPGGDLPPATPPPGEVPPGETPAETPPAGEAAPVEGAPVEGAPVEGAPVEGAPVEGAPVEGAPAEGAPVEGAGTPPAESTPPTTP